MADLFSDGAGEAASGSGAGPGSSSPSGAGTAPLAERLRPRTLDDIVGQSHLLGSGKPLRLAFESGKPHSMILWGPPGVGKTTLARLSARAFNAEFVALSAVLSGVKDIREAVEKARMNQARGRATIVFVDEVHRFNKAQQDAFLPYVESGLFTFIGATTENPSFEVNGALLSRAAVYVLKSLSPAELGSLFDRAVRAGDADGKPVLEGLEFDAQARERIIGLADGDARRLLNLLEIIDIAAKSTAVTGAEASASSPGAGLIRIDGEFVQNAVARNLRRFDKGGDAFYDQISALHKSVRGSSPDAALYWLVRMLDGGADPLYLARRLIRMAVEDIGLADPRALDLTLAAAQTYERLGSPEGELALAEAAIYLACAAKSNAVYTAFNAAREFVAGDDSREVPLHLRNAPTRLMKNLDYGRDYRYAHDEDQAYAAGETYLPEGMPAPQWYKPSGRGLEAKIAEKLAELRSLDEKTRSRSGD
jgi:putative ATPase